VRRRLYLLAAALVLPLVIATVLQLDYVYGHDRAAAQFQLQATARALSLVVDRQIGQIEAQLRALATSDALLTSDFVAFDRQARALNPGDGSWIVLRTPAGRQLVNTRLPLGASLPAGPVDSNAGEERARVTAEGPYVSNLIKASASADAIIGVDIPVMRDGAMEYDLAMVVPATVFARVFSDQKLPASWIGVIIDRNSVLVARSRNQGSTVGALLPAEFNQHVGAAAEGVVPGMSFEGEKTLFAYSRSASTGWTFGVAVPRGDVGAAARRSVYVAIAIGMVLFGTGALIARRVARGITRPIESLAGHAAALGQGEIVSEKPTGLVEADLAADALRQAGDSLRTLTATLEQRVAERTKDLADANQRLSQEIEERQRAERQLARVQRMEAVGQLTGGVAHDFNNLLQAVIGNLDLLKLRLVDARSARMIDNALLAAERGAKLTGQLLAFSRRQRLEAGPVDVNALILGLADMLRSTLGGTIVVETRLQEGLWSALADTTQFELMILNLAINARDAMPEGGQITIATANIERGEPTRPEEPAAGEYVEVVVSDNGTGIESDILARVFEPFFTTKAVGKGSGLGLSQVLGLAQQHGGGVVIESAPNVGTSVRVFLPRTKPQAAVAAGKELGAPPPDMGTSATILIADDEEQVRSVLASMLQQLGYRVAEADSGAAALKRLATDERIELLLVDYAMPGMNGTEVAVRAHALRPSLPVIIVTGYAQSAQLPPEIPVESVITKPVRAAQLAAVITAALTGGGGIADAGVPNAK